MTPDDALTCLFVQPRFSPHNFWNYLPVAHALGAKSVAPPLGLLTVAAMLPRHWSVSLVDLNVREVTRREWDAADLVCVGGMLPQQPSTLEVIAQAKQRGKYVVVGGADPTSQPGVYAAADALVLGEAEASLPLWLAAWESGQSAGVFQADERPDVTASPIPRFDLVDFDDYINPGVQLSRGCPFDCEFCDIIELYGRKPRSKTAEQLLAELECLYQLGYRGLVDLVDDNFIGNPRHVKPVLTALASWSAARRHPFVFSIEATLNLADDPELLTLMRDACVRFVFLGIETPDPDLLRLTQKPINATRPLNERVDRLYRHGIVVTAGFIMGFDDEECDNDTVIAACIEATSIAIAMVGLLVALPTTQLARRLQREGRLLSTDLRLHTEADGPYRLETAGTHAEYKDQAAGLNFVTTRDRVQIYQEYQRVLEAVYRPDAYMDRVLAATARLGLDGPSRPKTWAELRREIPALLRTMLWMTRRPAVRGLYWRNSWRTLRMGGQQFDVAQTLMAMFMHLSPQAGRVRAELDEHISFCRDTAAFPRAATRRPDLAHTAS